MAYTPLYKVGNVPAGSLFGYRTDLVRVSSRLGNSRSGGGDGFSCRGRDIGDGQRLFRALGEAKQLTAENLEHITGGNGYCWVVPADPLPVAMGGNPVYQGTNWRQVGLKNSGNLVLPTCDIHFVPYPTPGEAQQGKIPQDIFYHFEKVPVIMDRRQYRFTPYFITGDRIYSGTIETPTRRFIEVIKFEPDPKDPTRSIPSCLVQEFPELSAQGLALRTGKVLEKECFPQKFGLQKPK